LNFAIQPEVQILVLRGRHVIASHYANKTIITSTKFNIFRICITVSVTPPHKFARPSCSYNWWQEIKIHKDWIVSSGIMLVRSLMKIHQVAQ